MLDVDEVAKAQEVARQSISELMLETLDPDSTIFTEHVAHLCHAFCSLGARTMSGPAGELQGRLYVEIAGCASAARRHQLGARDERDASDPSQGRRKLAAESLRELCGSPDPGVDGTTASRRVVAGRRW